MRSRATSVRLARKSSSVVGSRARVRATYIYTPYIYTPKYHVIDAYEQTLMQRIKKQTHPGVEPTEPVRASKSLPMHVFWVTNGRLGVTKSIQHVITWPFCSRAMPDARALEMSSEGDTTRVVNIIFYRRLSIAMRYGRV